MKLKLIVFVPVASCATFKVPLFRVTVLEPL
nr:hypothetical protein YSBCXYJI_YSBCXYJI_CDS_0111 [Caudoviricetes sp.]